MPSPAVRLAAYVLRQVRQSATTAPACSSRHWSVPLGAYTCQPTRVLRPGLTGPTTSAVAGASEDSWYPETRGRLVLPARSVARTVRVQVSSVGRALAVNGLVHGTSLPAGPPAGLPAAAVRRQVKLTPGTALNVQVGVRSGLTAAGADSRTGAAGASVSSTYVAVAAGPLLPARSTAMTAKE